MIDRPTPETDAAERMAFAQEYMVPTDFARRLERERDEARSECKALWGMVDTEKKKVYNALRERDQARERAAKLAAQLLTEMEGAK